MTSLLAILENSNLSPEQKRQRLSKLLDRQPQISTEEAADFLICAFWTGHDELLQLFLDRGFDVDARQFSGSTTLFKVASADGKIGCPVCGRDRAWTRTTIQTLLRTKPDLIVIDGRFHRTCLHWAAFHGNVVLVEELLKHASSHFSDTKALAFINRLSFRREAALHLAAYQGHSKVVELLLDYGANVGATCSSNQTALHVASRAGHLQVVQALLDHNADVNAKTVDGTTALHLAAEADHRTLVTKLLSRKDILPNEGTKSYYTPMLKAKEKEHHEVVELFLPHVIKLENDTAAFEACRSFRANTFDFYLTQDNLGFVDTSDTSVHHALYNLDSGDFSYSGSQLTGQSGSKRSGMHHNFEWLDLPLNNATWAEVAITKNCIQSLPSDVSIYTQLLASLGQQQGRLRLHSRQLKPSCKLDFDINNKNRVFGMMYMPYLRWQTHEKQQHLLKVIDSTMEPTNQDAAKLDKEEALMRGYDLHRSTALHLRRTLHQFRYPAMNSQGKEQDQVVYRCYRQLHSTIGGVRWQQPRIYMVDQLWLWALPEVILTCMPEINDVHEIRDEVLYDINVNEEYMTSQAELVALILSRCIGLFDRHYQQQPELRFFELFEWSLGNLTEKVIILHSHFSSDISKVTAWLNRKTSSSRQYRIRKLKGSQQEDPSEESDLSFVNRLVDISVETQLHFECESMDDELTCLSMVLQEQEKIVAKFWATILPETRTNSLNSSNLRKQQLLHQEIFEHDLAAIARLRGQIKDAQKTLSELLDLKPRYATAIEARFTRDQAASTARQGQIIMVFTIVTIVFLPLSFLATFLTINISEFPRDARDELSINWVSKYVFGVGFGLSVPLVLMAFAYSDVQAWKRRLKSLSSIGSSRSESKSPLVGSQGQGHEMKRIQTGTSKGSVMKNSNQSVHPHSVKKRLKKDEESL